MTQPRPEPVGGTRSYLPAVEGLRACAAIGVVITHVALQTGTTHGWGGRLLIRLDLAVAVFFALSGFLLWRSHAAAARGLRPKPQPAPYLRSRLVRIMPAYLATVLVVLTLLPDARRAGPSVWIANLTLMQVYVPRTLYAGLSQMWSLSVEMSFYLALPLLAMAAARLPVRARVPVISLVALLSFGWGYLPIPTHNGANPLNWAPAYAAWFAVGMLLAECLYRPYSWTHWLARRPLILAGVGGAAYLVAASSLVVPPSFKHATVDQFIIRTLLGAVIAGCLLAPLVLDRPDARHRLLSSTAMTTVGRWSYGLFLWHLAALDMALAMLDRQASTGGFVIVLVLTLAFGLVMAAVSYALIEEPGRLALRRWELRRAVEQTDDGSAVAPVGPRAA
ncbi:peptidoglycan/LPS O-acetylase OafA/YrhL [Mycobacterium sp. MAA66]|uniref:acyltransferase family protein n=1 Tax=Mycobacterium sp. MAA66 TaxID=3156297 RepID=UPI003514C310